MDILGVDIGGSGIKGAIVDTITGELKSERIRIQTPQPATPEAVAKTLKELVDQIGYKGPVGCGFPARIINGEVLTAANIDSSWINIKVEELFSKTLNTDVFVANDADVAGLAELSFGAYHEEPFEVEWLFDKEVADEASKYIFHPNYEVRTRNGKRMRVNFITATKVNDSSEFNNTRYKRV